MLRIPIARTLRMMRQAISPRFATSTESNLRVMSVMSVALLQSRNTERIRLEITLARLRATLQREAQDLPGVARVDDALVENPSGCIERSGLAVEQVNDPLLLRVQPGFVNFDAASFGRNSRYMTHRRGSLLASHHTRFCVWPGKQKVGPISQTAHAVIAGAKTRSDIQSDARHSHIGGGLDHLRPVLDHSRLLVLCADHITRRVVEKNYRVICLVAQLQKLRRLGGAIRI